MKCPVTSDKEKAGFSFRKILNGLASSYWGVKITNNSLNTTIAD